MTFESGNGDDHLEENFARRERGINRFGNEHKIGANRSAQFEASDSAYETKPASCLRIS